MLLAIPIFAGEICFNSNRNSGTEIKIELDLLPLWKKNDTPGHLCINFWQIPGYFWIKIVYPCWTGQVYTCVPAGRRNASRVTNKFKTSGKRLMNQAQSSTIYNDNVVRHSTNTQLRNQLMREISCLERHLDRLKTNGYMKNQSTLDTYREMILSRKDLLSDLS